MDCRDPETFTDLPTSVNKHLPLPLKHLQIPLFAFVRTFNTRTQRLCHQQAGLGPSRTVTCGAHLRTRFCRPVRARTSIICTNHNVVTFRNISRHILPPNINTGHSYYLPHPPTSYSLTQATEKLSLSELQTTRTVRFKATRVSPKFRILYSTRLSGCWWSI
jgi:hypothetical protein